MTSYQVQILFSFEWCERIREEAVVGYLKYYSGICLEGPRRITESLSQYSRYPCRDSNMASPEYKSEAIPLESSFLISVIETA